MLASAGTPVLFLAVASTDIEMANESNWMRDEITTAGRENLDAVHASRYDVKEDASATEELKLVKTLGVNEQSEVVDMGAGTGQFALAVASACARVVAVDVSPIMLDVLTAKIAASRQSNIEVVQAGFLTYEHRGRPADLVYSRYALHHLPDFWKVLALQRLRRIVRVNGVLRLWDVVYNFSPTEAEHRLERWCAAFSDDVDAGWKRAGVEEHIRDEHSTFTWLLEPMVQRAGFKIEDAWYSPDGIFAKYIARAV